MEKFKDKENIPSISIYLFDFNFFKQRIFLKKNCDFKLKIRKMYNSLVLNICEMLKFKKKIKKA